MPKRTTTLVLTVYGEIELARLLADKMTDQISPVLINKTLAVNFPDTGLTGLIHVDIQDESQEIATEIGRGLIRLKVNEKLSTEDSPVTIVYFANGRPLQFPPGWLLEDNQ